MSDTLKILTATYRFSSPIGEVVVQSSQKGASLYKIVAQGGGKQVVWDDQKGVGHGIDMLGRRRAEQYATTFVEALMAHRAAAVAA